MKDIYYIYFCSTFYVYTLDSGSVYVTYFLVREDHIEAHHIYQFSTLVHFLPRGLVSFPYTIKYDDVNIIVKNTILAHLE